jgi:hypothetical protein
MESQQISILLIAGNLETSLVKTCSRRSLVKVCYANDAITS